MKLFIHVLTSGLVSLAQAAAAVAAVLNATDGKSHPLDLTTLFNNRGFSNGEDGGGNFDGSGGSYPAAHIPPSNLTYSGISYTFPSYKPSSPQPDNLLSASQLLVPPQPGHYFSIHLLASSTGGTTTGNITFLYADDDDDGDNNNNNNPTSVSAVRVPPWWSWPYPQHAELMFPYHYNNSTRDGNMTMIFEVVGRIDPERQLVGVRLPTPARNKLHIFAATLLAAEEEEEGKGAALEVQYAKATKKWLEDEGETKTKTKTETERVQIVDVLVNNVDASGRWIGRGGGGGSGGGSGVEVTVTGPGLQTVKPAYIRRLRPGDQARVQVGVINRPGVKIGARGPATVVLKDRRRNISTRRHTFEAVYGITEYSATLDSVTEHQSPGWYDAAKFGIFIHWGVYSVPGWGNVGANEVYAEWYWWNMNKGPGTKDDTFTYHRNTYGEDVKYDDFIANFTAENYDPKAWVDLFDAAGAKYFVSVISKHHDGYALFDLPAKVTRRTSVALHPHRNLLKELFDASLEHHPHLHRATYLSLPEWFNPSYTPYGFRLWPGGLAHDPYSPPSNTTTTLPYTGHVPISNYLHDLLLPQMQTLASMGTEIMWCDIGGPNLTPEFAASYYNTALKTGRAVAMNDRCGIPGDFTTPEYARYDSTVRRKWESNLGMDPYSYGYNRATPDNAYLNSTTIVRDLLDIISKGGNFLLDIGPRADGSIIEVQERALREVGMWIADGHGEGIYDTGYWFVQPQDVVGGGVRFVQTETAFYIWFLERPVAGEVRIGAPVPWMRGDEVVVVGGLMKGTVVKSGRGEDGVLVLTIPEEVAAAETVAWGFKIVY